jgi:3-deoxy-manno-octulosonate cytidylyltransferase (CMP-KDO synthetase)
MIAVGIIPSRYASTRLPGKPLLTIGGKPMIRHVYERARAARSLSRVLVATDDERILDAVRAFGGDAVLTAGSHRSGTDRVAEAARDLDADVVVNIQGDEPMLAPEPLDALVAAFAGRPELEIATLAHPIRTSDEAADPAAVKVVMDRDGYALYFSRLPIPYDRDGAGAARWRHLGVYAYRKAALLRFAHLPPTPLEQSEALEQLRALENGMRILVLATDQEAIGVDTPEDLERVRALFTRST